MKTLIKNAVTIAVGCMLCAMLFEGCATTYSSTSAPYREGNTCVSHR